MELKLRHLLPYAEHKLDVMWQDYPCEVEGFDFHQKGTVIVERISVPIKDVKPILYPFDLKVEIEFKGRKFVPLNELLRLNHFNVENMSKEDILEYEDVYMDRDFLSYDDSLRLFKWHIDINNLIPKGLAIDINFLKNKVSDDKS